jgi:hypothetical protein
VRGSRRAVLGLGRARGTLSRAPRLLAIALGAPVALLAAGCGGGSPQTQGEPSGNFPIRVVHASFPLAQAVSRPANLTLAVRNVGTSTAPNVAITVNSFEYMSNYPNLADPKRPTWVIEQGPGPIANPPVETQEVSQPGGGVTAYVNTWALGPLAPGAVRVFTWHVVPVKTGLQVVRYVVAAGLAGKAKAVRPVVGGPVKGAFLVHIGTEPPPTHVDPSTGKVVPGPAPQTP